MTKIKHATSIYKEQQAKLEAELNYSFEAIVVEAPNDIHEYLADIVSFVKASAKCPDLERSMKKIDKRIKEGLQYRDEAEAEMKQTEMHYLLAGKSNARNVKKKVKLKEKKAKRKEAKELIDKGYQSLTEKQKTQMEHWSRDYSNYWISYIQ